MQLQTTLLPQTEAWEQLQAYAEQIASRHMRTIFRNEPNRGSTYTAEAAGIFIDYSKHRIDGHAMELLQALATDQGLEQKISAMFSGETINTTENRAVLHTALRNQSGQPVIFQGVDVMPDVLETLSRMKNLSEAIRGGSYLGFSNKPVKHVICIGIGGSNLGPLMTVQALSQYADPAIDIRFVSNIDPADLHQNLHGLDPAETIFIIASKTFTTTETLTNARAARDWIVSGMGSESAVASHFIALSTAIEQVQEFGIDQHNIFGFWDWVDGRYSVWSAIGLPLMVAIGSEGFHEFLHGAYDMDEHFRTAPVDKNIPIILGLISIWYRNFFGTSSEAILPYSYNLRRFPAYCQQLIMESNGKTTLLDGAHATYQTSPVIWGESGTDAQHSFFQLLHQGSDIVPTDFIGVIHQDGLNENQQELLLSNMLAQTKALAFGKTEDPNDPLNAHRRFLGNCPSTTILIEKLTPYTLGSLIALYEHRTFVQGAIWNINSFDQFGVELGKKLAIEVKQSMDGDLTVEQDSSTAHLIRRIKDSQLKS